MENKILLITGGTGSFGRTALNEIIQSDAKEIRIFSRDEKKQDDMRHEYNNKKLKFYIGDVRDRRSVCEAMKGVNFVFHAAALKQVPSCEFFPLEAVRTNVLGTANVLDAAIEQEVERVVVLSTDKAVYPINAMGLSKALAEKIALAKSRNQCNTIICATRYGNVLASRGSVVPLFIEQIKSGRPITITDPNMTRFMMTLQDAVRLVIYAMNHGQQGDIFIQKSPACTIGDLATALLDLYESNNKINIIGTRHGEKLFETLMTREEMSRSVDLGDYYKIPADTEDLNYGLFFTEGEITMPATDYTSHTTRRLTIKEIQSLLEVGL